MRILQVCSARTLGGGERHVADLAQSLSAKGHDVFVALAPKSPLVEKLNSLPSENIFFVRMRNALDLPSALKLARIVREHEIDIVHAHLARDYPLASLAVRRYACLVISRHVLFPLSRFHRKTLSRAARVIAVSESVAARLRQQRIVDDGKISVIHNGINLERFSKRRTNAEREAVRAKLGVQGRFVVGTVGSLLPLKGNEEFVRAAGSIASAHPDVDFVIVGDEDPSHRHHRAELEAVVTELNLGDRLRIVDWKDDLALFYDAIDVYVSASRSEAFGLSIVEAMASGKPVVATATEGAKEIVDDGTTGMLVDIGDVERLAGCVGTLLDNAGERDAMGARARVAAAQFSLEKMVDETEGLYREVMRKE